MTTNRGEQAAAPDALIMAPNGPRPRGRRTRRLAAWGAGLLGGLVLLATVGVIYESFAEDRDGRVYSPPGRMIDVGGHRMHIDCRGEGSPTVVIDAGLGDWSSGWAWVQPEVARTTRVCTYDRSGVGWSEPGPLPRTAEQAAQELHALLAGADVPPPYIVVGHSLGGLTVRVFAGEHPDDVSGVVLVDSMSPPISTTRADEILTPPRARFGLDSLVPALARVGLARLLAAPLGLMPSLPPEADDAYRALGVRTSHLQTFMDEMRAVPQSLEQARRVTSLGAVPLTVLSRARHDGQDVEWHTQQRALPGLSSNSQHRFAADSGHNIPSEEPQTVVGAIVEMVERTR